MFKNNAYGRSEPIHLNIWSMTFYTKININKSYKYCESDKQEFNEFLRNFVNLKQKMNFLNKNQRKLCCKFVLIRMKNCSSRFISAFQIVVGLRLTFASFNSSNPYVLRNQFLIPSVKFLQKCQDLKSYWINHENLPKNGVKQKRLRFLCTWKT